MTLWPVLFSPLIGYVTIRADSVMAAAILHGALSSLVPDKGLIGALCPDAKLIYATLWEPYQELVQAVARDLPFDLRLGGLQLGESKLIRGKIYALYQ